MESREECDVDNDLDSGHGVGNGLDRGRVDVINDDRGHIGTGTQATRILQYLQAKRDIYPATQQ